MNGTMVVTVALQDGSRLPGAICTVTAPDLQGSRTSVTSENGEALIRLLPPGVYKLVVEMEGFSTATIKDIDVRLDQTVPVEVTMTVAPVTER